MTEVGLPVFELETLGVQAKGQPQADGSFLLLAGSTVRAQVVESSERRVSPGYREHRQRLLDTRVLQPDPETGELVLTRDELCNSSTEAACIVAGRMANGYTDWTTHLSDGQRMSHKEWLDWYWGSKDTPVFTMKADRITAYGQMQSGKFVVFAGSQARPGVTPSMDIADKELKEQLIQDGYLQSSPDAEFLEFVRDTPFPTGTAAACIIMLRTRGTSTGWYFTNEKGEEVSFGDWMGMLSNIPKEVRQRRMGMGSARNDDPGVIEPQVNRTAIVEEITQQTNILLNQILYGPPGTGKTYQVVERTLAILDPGFLQSHMDRAVMKARYDELTAQGRISFVTFHQSFGYEDFIEGIKPVMKGGQLSYKLFDGIFLEAVRAAGGELQRPEELDDEAQHHPSPATAQSLAGGLTGEMVRPDAQVWRIYIDGAAHSSQLRDRSVQRGEIRVGSFGRPVKDLSAVSSEDLQVSQAFFRDGIHVGDLILLATKTDRIGAVGVVTGEYHFDPSSEVIFSQDYAHARSVHWLLTDISLDAQEITGRQFAPPTLQRVVGLTAKDVLQKLPLTTPENQPAKPLDQPVLRPHVLIIDELNRGNVAKIFGELITLLETGKRAGRSEALTVKLPLSRRPLSVPDTLYVIGTMNTADRSLTQLDTALRRRFTFHPVWPEPEVLRPITIDGTLLDLRKFLYAINERIERLLSREQMIGHAYLLDLPSNLQGVAGALRERILPQLEEYFFDDWGKIREILGDPGKPDHLQFIQLLPNASNAAEKRYRVNEAAFNELEAFRMVYASISDHAFPFED